MGSYRLQFSRLGWRGQIGLVLAVALGLAAAVALVIVSVGLALILLPIVAVALLISRWRLKRTLAEVQARWEDRERQMRNPAIETEYEVIDRDQAR